MRPGGGRRDRSTRGFRHSRGVGVGAGGCEIVPPFEPSNDQLARLAAFLRKPPCLRDRAVLRARVAQNDLVDVIPERLEARAHVVPLIPRDHHHRQPQAIRLAAHQARGRTARSPDGLGQGRRNPGSCCPESRRLPVAPHHWPGLALQGERRQSSARTVSPRLSLLAVTTGKLSNHAGSPHVLR